VARRAPVRGRRRGAEARGRAREGKGEERGGHQVPRSATPRPATPRRVVFVPAARPRVHGLLHNDDGRGKVEEGASLQTQDASTGRFVIFSCVVLSRLPTAYYWHY